MGSAAYGFLNGISYFNYLKANDHYNSLKKGQLPIWRVKKLTKNELKARMIVLGLTFYEGVSRLDYENRFGEPIETTYGDIISDLKQKGMLEEVDDHIRLT